MIDIEKGDRIMKQIDLIFKAFFRAVVIVSCGVIIVMVEWIISKCLTFKQSVCLYVILLFLAIWGLCYGYLRDIAKLDKDK